MILRIPACICFGITLEYPAGEKTLCSKWLLVRVRVRVRGLGLELEL